MKYVAIALIRAYQRLISPYLPSSCIFHPSCSDFAIEAYRRHGFWRGSLSTAWRLLRCGPWGIGGDDPVH